VLGSAFSAAGLAAAGFAAVAVPSLGRIGEALKAQETAAKSAGAATGGAGQSAAQAALQALQLEAAEKRLADAQRDERQAQEDLTRAREAGRRALEDMNFSLDRSILSQKDAALAVKEAAARLAEVNADSKSSDLERERAALSYEMALQRQEEQEVKTARARKDTAAANRAGVEGTKEYTRAQDDLKQAQDKVAQAEMQLKQLHLQQQQAMSGGGGAANSLADAFANLSKEERKLAKEIKAFKDGYVDWQRSLQPDVFPVISSGLALMNTGMKTATPLIKSSSKAFKQLIDEMNEGLKSEQWTSFFDDIAEEAPRAIEGLGKSAGNVAGGLAGVIQAFLPYTDELMTFLEDATQGFEDWGQSLKGSPEFEAFIAYARENGPKVAEIFGNIATFAGKIVEVGADIGPGVLDFLVTLSDKLAGMDPAQVEAIAQGVAAIFAAVKLGATLQVGALVILAQVLGEMSPGQIQGLAIAIAAVVTAVKGYQAVSGAVGFFQGLSGSLDKAGGSADTAKGKLSGLAGSLKAGGILAAVAALVAGVDKVTDELSGLNPALDTLEGQIVEFARKGAVGPELLNQFGSNLNTLAGDMGKSAVWFAPAIGTFESLGDSAARLASDNPFEKIGTGFAGLADTLSGGLLSLDSGAQRISNLDQALAQTVKSGNGGEAALLFSRIAEQAREAGTPVEKLKDLFPNYTASLAGAVPATAEMASAMSTLGHNTDPTAVAMERFNASLDTFNSKTDVAQRTLELKAAFDEAKTAIADAGGKLDFTAQMTDKQKQAIIQARDQFGGYIEKVLGAARAAGEMAGKTGDAALKSEEARNAFIRQIPQLFELAGKSSEAKAQIYALAEGFGINRTQADKAKTGVDGVRDTIKELKGKQVEVGVDNKQGLAAIAELKRQIGLLVAQSVTISMNAAVKNERGNILAYEQGGIEAYASGGMRPGPHIATKPTVLYGEGTAPEAYIPYDPSFRSRAVGLLSQVADDFGLALVGAGDSAPVNSSRVSRPQQMRGGFVAGSYGSGGGQAFTGGRSSAGAGGAPVINVDMSGSTIREEADVPRLAAEFGFEYTARA
jgi:hypothetical protein